MFWHKDKTQSVDSFKAENEFESNFTPAAAGGRTITIIGNNAFSNGLLERLNKTKESHMVSMYFPLPRLFGFCQNINHVYRGVTHQIILKRNDFSYMIIKS